MLGRQARVCGGSQPHHHALSIGVDVHDLARVRHAAAPRALRDLVAQLGQRHVGPVALDQFVDPIPATPTARVAGEAEHVELARGLAEGIGAVGHIADMLGLAQKEAAARK
jgi:hypothetical protein